MNRLLPIALALTACSFDPMPLEIVSNTCETDDVCSGGATCDLGAGMCVSVPETPLMVGFQITPAMDEFGATPATVTFGPYEVYGESVQSLEMPAPITVFGSLPFQAEVTFESVSAFRGGEQTRFATSTRSEAFAGADGEGANFQLRLVSGRSYSVRIQPSGEAVSVYAPLRFDSVEIPTGEDAVRLEIAYPAVLHALSGEILSPDGLGTQIPQDGLWVRAVSAETGLVVSSTAVTGEDGVPGAFTIYVAPEVGPYLLRITATTDRPLFPTITVDPETVFLPDAPHQILVPNLAHVRYVGLVEAPDGTPLPEAVLTFRSTDVLDRETQLVGSFRATATAGPDGRFGLDLLPGSYEVVVEAPTEDDLGVLLQSVRVSVPTTGNTQMGQLFTPPTRTRFGGIVTAAGGEPVEGATVLAHALQREAEGSVSPVARYNRDSRTVTDTTGRFDLGLDVGTFDLVLQPPEQSRYPWLVKPEQTVGAAEGTLGDEFELPAPIPIEGILEAPEGQPPMAGAEVRVFAILPNAADGERAIQVARSIANPEGLFRALLPPHL